MAVLVKLMYCAWIWVQGREEFYGKQAVSHADSLVSELEIS